MAKFGVMGTAQLTLPNTRQVLPPSIMMLVKGDTGWKRVLCSRGDESIDVTKFGERACWKQKMQPCCCTAAKGINGSWDRTQWIEACPKVSSTRLARRFLQDDGCGKSYEGVFAIGRVTKLKMLHFVTFLIKCKLVHNIKALIKIHICNQ